MTHVCKALIFRVRPKYHLIITHLKEKKTDEKEVAHQTWEVKYKYFGKKSYKVGKIFLLHLLYVSHVENLLK